MNVLQIAISAVISAVVTIALGLIIKRPLEKRADAAEKKAEADRVEREAIMAGMQALLRDRLLQGFRHHEELGYANYDDRSNMENMYNAYHNLGKNGVMDELYKKFLTLPEHLSE